jgi:hypothetical protein
MIYLKKISILLAIVLFIFLIGCSENETADVTSDPTNSNNTDKQADDTSISSLISEEQGEIGEFRNGEEFYEPLDEISPMRFRRQVTSRTIQKEIEYIDEDHATVIHSETIEGTFHILTEDSVHIEKPFVDNAYRTFDLIRVGDRGDRHRGWRISASSGTEFWSEENTVEILEIHIVAGELDTVITNISEKIPREQMLGLPMDTEVTMTVTTTHTDDELFLHRPRKHFDSNGDGTYTVNFMTPSHPRRARLTTDALSHGTLHDDEAPYDSNGWVMPIRIGPPPPPPE